MNLARSPMSPWLLAAGAALMLAAVPAGAADPSQFSRAENLVFVNKHLGNLKLPSSLQYSFARSGPMEPAFEDQVRIEVARNGKACCKVQGDFLTGERRLALPEIPDAEANPVILYFLERDIREMQRLTKGRSNYFQKRIRMTMVDEAKVRDTTISFQGRELPAKEVTLAPYVNDPARSRYERFAEKRYVFVLAEGVPGGVYQIRTALPGALPADPPAIEEVMTFTGVEAGAAPKTSKK